MRTKRLTMKCAQCNEEIKVVLVEAVATSYPVGEDGEIDWYGAQDPETIDKIDKFCKCGCGEGDKCPYYSGNIYVHPTGR